MDSRDIRPIVQELERINKNLKRLADLFEKMNRQKQQEAQYENQRSETDAEEQKEASRASLHHDDLGVRSLYRLRTEDILSCADFRHTDAGADRVDLFARGVMGDGTIGEHNRGGAAWKAYRDTTNGRPQSQKSRLDAITAARRSQSTESITSGAERSSVRTAWKTMRGQIRRWKDVRC